MVEKIINKKCCNNCLYYWVDLGAFDTCIANEGKSLLSGDLDIPTKCKNWTLTGKKDPKGFLEEVLSYIVETNEGKCYRIIGVDYNGVDALIGEASGNHDFIGWEDIKAVYKESNC